MEEASVRKCNDRAVDIRLIATLLIYTAFEYQRARDTKPQIPRVITLCRSRTWTRKRDKRKGSERKGMIILDWGR